MQAKEGNFADDTQKIFYKSPQPNCAKITITITVDFIIDIAIVWLSYSSQFHRYRRPSFCYSILVDRQSTTMQTPASYPRLIGCSTFNSRQIYNKWTPISDVRHDDDGTVRRRCLSVSNWVELVVACLPFSRRLTVSGAGACDVLWTIQLNGFLVFLLHF